MTENQKSALRTMDERNLGAVFVPGGPNGGWVFPCRIREDAELAKQVCERLRKQKA